MRPNPNTLRSQVFSGRRRNFLDATKSNGGTYKLQTLSKYNTEKKQQEETKSNEEGREICIQSSSSTNAKMAKFGGAAHR